MRFKMTFIKSTFYVIYIFMRYKKVLPQRIKKTFHTEKARLLFFINNIKHKVLSSIYVYSCTCIIGDV